MTKLLSATAIALVLIAAPAFAQNQVPAPASIPNANAVPAGLDCGQRMTVAAQGGETQRMAGAREITEAQPKFSDMNCLGDVMNGAGIDIFGVGVDPMSILTRIKNQVCSAGVSALTAAKSQTQGCGIYGSGWNAGVPGFGMGQLCRSIYVGGGGGDIYGTGTRRPSTGFGSVFGRSPDMTPSNSQPRL
jgi:hypothetical protein